MTLEGRVETWRQREAAEKAVRNLAGVRVVVNRVEIAPEVYAGDVRSAIVVALSRHAARAAEHLDIVVHDGIVRVSGCVDSKAVTNVVPGTVMGTHGVRTVDDDIRIAVPAAG